jgi:hypothetical protein
MDKITMGYYEKDEWGTITGYISDIVFDCEECKREELFNRWVKVCGHPDCGYAYAYRTKEKRNEPN